MVEVSATNPFLNAALNRVVAFFSSTCRRRVTRSMGVTGRKDERIALGRR